MSVVSTIDHLECPRCAARHDHRRPAFLCGCGSPLLVRYRLGEARRSMTPAALRDRPPTMWRYREVLPGAGEPVSLGEGMTPLHQARRLGAGLGMEALFIKDESVNPTGSFKARGLSAAVTVARELGARQAAVPSAGNAGGALAAYGALAGIRVKVYLPETTPAPFFLEARVHGAEIEIVAGSIADCARRLAGENRDGAWYDVSTLKEPYRIEGKKTMGYELFEQSAGRLPDAIIYPTGGGTGLIGMWKAFEEMEALGWIGRERPRMYSVQAAGCAPIVRAFEAGQETAGTWQDPATYASGLRVPAARGDFLILRALRESGGGAVAVTDEEMAGAVREIGAGEGIHAAPEGGATLAALRALLSSGAIRPSEQVVLFNTGTGLKYPDPVRAGGVS
jgi:threonine synthase